MGRSSVAFEGQEEGASRTYSLSHFYLLVMPFTGVFLPDIYIYYLPFTGRNRMSIYPKVATCGIYLLPEVWSVLDCFLLRVGEDV